MREPRNAESVLVPQLASGLSIAAQVACASPKATFNACSRAALIMDHGRAKHIAQQGKLAQGLFGGIHVAVFAGIRTRQHPVSIAPA